MQYVAQGGNLKSLGYEYTGTLQLVHQILKSDYLWDKIHINSGAYGINSSLNKQGDLIIVSYRDPNIKESLKTYQKAGEYISKCNLSKKDLEEYKITILGRLDVARLTPSQQGDLATNCYILGITTEDLFSERKEILESSLKDVQKNAEMIDKIMEQNYYCVVGNKQKLKENSELFSKIIDVMK